MYILTNILLGKTEESIVFNRNKSNAKYLKKPNKLTNDRKTYNFLILDFLLVYSVIFSVFIIFYQLKKICFAALFIVILHIISI